MLRFTKALESAEEALGAILAVIIAVGMMVSAVLIGLENANIFRSDTLWRFPVVGAVCLLEFLHVCALLRAYGKHPYAPAVAISFPKLPVIARIPVAVFWSMHLLFVCGFIWAAQSSVEGASLLTRIVLIILAAALSYLAFGYLLNAVAALKPEPSVLNNLWSKRRWYALVIAAIVVLLPFTGFVRRIENRSDAEKQRGVSTSNGSPTRPEIVRP